MNLFEGVCMLWIYNLLVYGVIYCEILIYLCVLLIIEGVFDCGCYFFLCYYLFYFHLSCVCFSCGIVFGPWVRCERLGAV